MDISSDVEKTDFWGWNCKNDPTAAKKKKKSLAVIQKVNGRIIT